MQTCFKNLLIYNSFSHQRFIYLFKSIAIQLNVDVVSGNVFSRIQGWRNSTEVRVGLQVLGSISYCRLKNLTVGYTLPKKWTDKINVGNVRFYFSGENLHYWAPGFHSDYIDPEMAQTGASTMRIYPWQKSFIFGVDLSF